MRAHVHRLKKDGAWMVRQTIEAVPLFYAHADFLHDVVGDFIERELSKKLAENTRLKPYLPMQLSRTSDIHHHRPLVNIQFFGRHKTLVVFVENAQNALRIANQKKPDIPFQNRLIEPDLLPLIDMIEDCHGRGNIAFGQLLLQESAHERMQAAQQPLQRRMLDYIRQTPNLHPLYDQHDRLFWSTGPATTCLSARHLKTPTSKLQWKYLVSRQYLEPA